MPAINHNDSDEEYGMPVLGRSSVDMREVATFKRLLQQQTERATTAEAEVERLRTLILTAPSYLGARQPLHNEWLRQAEEAVGPSIYEDHDLPNAS